MFNWRDIAERALWTAVQAAIGALPAGITVSELTDKNGWKVIGLSAGAAVIGALISFAKNVVKQMLEAKAA